MTENLVSRDEWQDSYDRDPVRPQDAITPVFLDPVRAQEQMHDEARLYANYAGRGGLERPALTDSPQWNTIVASKDAVLDYGDPIVVQHIENREQSVRKVAELARERYPAILDSLKEGIESGIAQGYIPEGVMDRWAATASLTPVQVADAVIGEGAHGHYDANSDEVSVYHDLETAEELEHAIRHELLHKVSGGTFKEFEDVDDESITVWRTKLGFSNANKAGRQTKRGITEVLNEHITLGCEDGDFATLDPDERLGSAGKYWGERKLFAEFVKRSGGLIDLRTVSRSSFADNDELADRRIMVAQAREAYGPGAYNKLEALMDIVANDPREERPLVEALAACIHPPELDENGVALRAGRIDIDSLALAA